MIIYNEIDTIKKLQQGFSISRFGDGEFRLINGKNMVYQDYNPIIASKLKNVLSHNNIPPKLLIGIPPFYQNKNEFYCPIRFTNKKVINYWKKYLSNKESKKMEQIINYDNIYYSSFISRIESFNYNNKDYISELNKIWKDKKIVLILNQFKYNEFKNIIYQNINNVVGVIYCTEKNAFSEYDNLFEKCKNYDKDTIFLIMAGPTATILSFDLCLIGYQSIDIGSFFDFFNMQV